MRFFFPDSQDQVDPEFDFHTERRVRGRQRGRDDLYAHEVFATPPCDGILVSKAMVEGYGTSGGRFSIGQRNRLLNEGVRAFYRLDERAETRHLESMGDCGAFSYRKEQAPPWSVDQVIEFYEGCGFDHGISVDHLILDFDASVDSFFPDLDGISPEHRHRQHLTLELADEFFQKTRALRCRFNPVGVAQGWSPDSYARAVERLQEMGYRALAIGGMAKGKTRDILALLERVKAVLRPGITLHLLGISRASQLQEFQRLGATSFDSTSALMQAWQDDRDNYHTLTRAYSAVRVPQVQGNPDLMDKIASGVVDQDKARRLERASLEALRAYDEGTRGIDEVLDVLRKYEYLCDPSRKSRAEAYREVLQAMPWKECACAVCESLGIDVIIFRGAERNRRRGFHNVHVLYQQVSNAVPVGIART
ncbi:MAG TPA: tRNA-guanine transglycosylase DpdA [Longimicrobium sp.]|nr:tRNA-guanine transglycosylase DpdA [Longimicrobium sp.]